MAYCPYCGIGLDNYQMKNRKCNNCLHQWETFHVLPMDDEKEHEESYKCHCLPKVINEGENIIIVHNSFDGRENFEPDSDMRQN